MILLILLVILLVIATAAFIISVIQDRRDAEVELFQRTHIIYLSESLCEFHGIEVEKVVLQEK